MHVTKDCIRNLITDLVRVSLVDRLGSEEKSIHYVRGEVRLKPVWLTISILTMKLWSGTTLAKCGRVFSSGINGYKVCLHTYIYSVENQWLWHHFFSLGDRMSAICCCCCKNQGKFWISNFSFLEIHEKKKNSKLFVLIGSHLSVKYLCVVSLENFRPKRSNKNMNKS